MTRRWGAIAVTATIGLLAAACQPATLVSVGGQGQANGTSNQAALNGDGSIVAFESNATNLVPGDTKGFQDVFVRDLRARTTERVSVGSHGEEANNDSRSPDISDDGRFVLFTTGASNLAPDTNGTSDVFVRDRLHDVTILVSRTAGGATANGFSDGLAITPNGRYVLFASSATNLDGAAATRPSALYRADLVAGTIRRVAKPDCDRGPGFVGGPADITADGTKIAFQRGCLVEHTLNDETMQIVAKRVDSTKFTVLDSLLSTEDFPMSFTDVDYAADGSLLEWCAYNIAHGSGDSDLSLWTGSGPIQRLAHDETTCFGGVSGDGRYVAWTNIKDGGIFLFDENPRRVLVLDRSTNRTVDASLNKYGAPANGPGGAGPAALSSDGTRIAFSSDATDIVDHDTNGQRDVFQRSVVNVFGGSPAATRVSG
jgi:hypothetical protein